MHNEVLQGEAQLQSVVAVDPFWSVATEQVIVSEIEFCEQAERYGHKLAAAVVDEGCDLSIKHLRKFVQWANNLDKEAVEYAGTPDLCVETGQREIVGRRLMHQAAKIALQYTDHYDSRSRYRFMAWQWQS